MNTIETIIDVVNQCPEYIGKGILQLIVLTIGGVLVAWITTWIFGRRSEINAVEGALLKRKLEIYEELCGKLEALKAVVIIPSDVHEVAVRMLGESGIRFNPINSDQLLSIFDAPRKLTEEFLNIDKYIAAKRLYYDNDVYVQTMRFQNYFACLRRLLVMFEEQFVNAKISLDKPEVAAAERLLTVEIGMMFQDELVEQMDKVIATMKQSFMNLNFAHREQMDYNYDFFNSPDGPIMSDLVHTKLFAERDETMRVVTETTALAMTGSMMTEKKK